MEATFSSWFLGPYKVSKIVYGLFSYALQPAKRTIASFMGANLEEFLVSFNFCSKKNDKMLKLVIGGSAFNGASPSSFERLLNLFQRM